MLFFDEHARILQPEREFMRTQVREFSDYNTLQLGVDVPDAKFAVYSAGRKFEHWQTPESHGIAFEMPVLVVTAILWLALHVGVAGTPLRDKLVGAIGERGFRGGFTVASVLVVAGLCAAYNTAPTTYLWTIPGWLMWLLDVAMLPAWILFIASLTATNPTMAGTEQAYGQSPRGIFRVTRHPMLCSFAIWACVHVIAAGDLASTVFFGTFLVTVLLGIPSIDGKLARRDPAKWQVLAPATSRLPFAAILAGRNRFSAPEIGWKSPIIGTAVWVAVILAHPHVVGVPAWPG